MKRPIAITFALPVESSALRSQLLEKTDATRDGVPLTRGRIGQRKVQLVHTGVGQHIAERRMESFLRDQDFALLISAGFAGAATQDLLIGDLIASQNFSDSELLSMAQEVLEPDHLRAVKLFTSATMIQSDAERTTIAEAHGAAAVDMETETIANACSGLGIALLSLRAISDSASEPLPAPANVLFDLQRQRTPFLRLAGYAVSHPAVIGRLFRFRRQIAKARERLTDAIVAVISKL